MQDIIKRYNSRFTFVEGERFRYHPDETIIEYRSDVPDNNAQRSKLLHEISHGILRHSLSSDLDKLTMEHDADLLARELLATFAANLAN